MNLLKCKTALEELPADSTDVVADNFITRYSKRPKCIEHYCLADYASELQIVYPKDEASKQCIEEENKTGDDNVNDSDTETMDETQTIIKLINGMTIRRRKSKKVIRYVRFNRQTDSENFYRERLMLFHPWRNEQTDLLGGYESYEEHYSHLKKIIDTCIKVNQYEQLNIMLKN